MAEAIAVVGVVASIVQLVDFSSTVLHRLEEFQSRLGDVPRSFRHIKVELPILQDTLQQTSKAIEAGLVRDETKKALVPAIEGCTEQIGLLDSILAKVLPIAADSRLKRGAKAILSLHQEAKIESITKILRSYVGTLTFYYAAISSTLQPLTDEKLAKIRQWLSPPDPSVNYQKALKQRQADTGLWFLQSNVYDAWRKDPSSILWLHGIPGCGKTILSSTILQNIIQHCSDDPGKVVAYFYFDFNNTKKQSPESMARSLISQLSQQCVKIPATLDTLFSSCETGQRQPSLDALLEVMHDMMQEFPDSYIVLDALDECTDRAELMSIIEKIAGWKLDKSHLLVTSRKERDIESSLMSIVDTHNTICLQSDVVDSDIFKYVRQRLSDDMSLRKWQKDDVMHEIETALMKGAHGMFRWAACQLDTLGKCRNRLNLRKCLATLPPTLDATYEHILCAIDKEDSEYAVRILRWLAFSRRPLLVEEIAEVVAINIERKPAFNREEVLEDPLDVLSICSSLVTITTTSSRGTSSRVVALAHYSVKEYLISERILQSRASLYSMQRATCNKYIAKSCIGYLLQFQAHVPLDYVTIKKSTLAEYAASCWIIHTQAIAYEKKCSNLSRLALELFSDRDGAYLNWIRIYNLEKPSNSPNFRMQLADVAAPLYYASLKGLFEIVALLVLEAGDNSADVNAQGGYYGTALQAASAEGFKKIVNLLLANGADVNAKGGHYSTALLAASTKGYNVIVELLLARGADVNTQGGEYGTALQAALAKGYGNIAQLLLAKGPDVNVQGGYYGNALQVAAAKGYDNIVQLLLAKGASINVQGGYYGNALQAASANGYNNIVQLLLAKGASINVRGGYFGTALQAASQKGYDSIVQLLLAKGADINLEGGFSGTPIELASQEGHESIVKLLLDSGADVNVDGWGDHSALQAASKEGHESIVKLLLANGASVDAQRPYSGTAIELASQEGNESIIELLLDSGADVNVQGWGEHNALQAASKEGHESIVKLLLANGVIIDAHRPDSDTALELASQEGHESIVKLLLDSGADVHARGERRYNALYAASSRGYENIVKLLLASGADVHTLGGSYGTALRRASKKGYESIVKLLLAKGTDADVQEGNYTHALYSASKGGHENIVKLLLASGAHVQGRGSGCKNALYAASSRGYDNVVKLLLTSGAVVNWKGRDGTALQAASSRGFETVVELLLAHGASHSI